MFWAAYILFGKKVGHLHAGHSVALGLTMAAVTVVPFGVWHAGSALLQPGILLFGLGVAAVSSAIPISLEMVALKRLTPAAFRRHGQHGAGRGRADGGAGARRTPERPAVAGHSGW